MERDLVVIGGSAGALEPLSLILGKLPAQFPAAVFVVLHTSSESVSVLPEILGRATPLPVAYAVDQEPIHRGRVYVAPQNYHLRMTGAAVSIQHGPHENGFRPAIDPLFRSAARSYGSRVIGVLLSGAMDDGTFGLSAIKEAGGLAVVQHPYEAMMPSMPLSAIQNVEVDHIVRAKDIAKLLLASTGITAAETALDPLSVPTRSVDERDITLDSVPPDELTAVKGPPVCYSCPECGGTLWEVEENGQFRFRCHTGHGFTPKSLLDEQNGQLEHALWTAIRVLQERSSLHRKMAESCRHRGMESTAQRYAERAEDELKKVYLLREFLDRAVDPVASPIPPIIS